MDPHSGEFSRTVNQLRDANAKEALRHCLRIARDYERSATAKACPVYFCMFGLECEKCPQHQRVFKVIGVQAGIAHVIE